MIILLIGISIEMCLAAVTIAMLYNIKKSNDAWWRTYWAKDKIMMDKILQIEKMWRDR